MDTAYSDPPHAWDPPWGAHRIPSSPLPMGQAGSTILSGSRRMSRTDYRLTAHLSGTGPLRQIRSTGAGDLGREMFLQSWRSRQRRLQPGWASWPGAALARWRRARDVAGCAGLRATLDDPLHKPLRAALRAQQALGETVRKVPGDSAIAGCRSGCWKP
jgi:hypothetical protein